MEKQEKINAYFEKDGPFREAIQKLRQLAHQTGSEEDYKWNFPVYTWNNKNVFGICRFKSYFGVWFFNGVFLKDPLQVLENAQEGKTKAMRHWKLTDISQIDDQAILSYMEEAIENQKKGLEVKAERKSTGSKVAELLKTELEGNLSLKTAFSKFTPFKQKEFSEYIDEAKQEATKLKRLQKIIPLIEEGVGLNDAYRKKST
nr:DUF1801 domain-containing protein [Allomuricauda sp.]